MDCHISTVIMLTRVFEGKVKSHYPIMPDLSSCVYCFLQKKCQQYYPVNIDETYTPCNGSGFTVVLTKSVLLPSENVSNKSKFSSS